ncbi:TolC family protein [Desulfoluna spongiiphila]|uniref:Outer membrane protein TolC n=1 Tax=Desulfoluna spongiiphila TaxID=419481 RepID=A0A1G5EH50_9BACT|nr:TolC family protein [Desulfoluna spongiiphila]SCY26287.1 Outer membrane protein TolC [Desulfoluna spongiiphila]
MMMKRQVAWGVVAAVCAVLCLGARAGATERVTIEEAVAEALRSNPAVAGADAELAASREVLTGARADRLPTLSAGYYWTNHNREPVQKSALGTYPAGYKEESGWDVQVVQPLFAGYSLKSAHELARLGVDSEELNRLETLQQLSLNVRQACHRLLLAKRLLAVAEDEVISLTSHRRVAVLNHDQGLIPLNDLLKAEVALAEAIQNRNLAESETEKARIAINRLLHRDPSGPLDLADMHAPPVWAQSSEELEILAVMRRPLVALLRLGIRQASVGETAAKSGYYPRVDLVGRYAKSGDAPFADENEFTHTDSASVTLQASWTLWNWGKTGAGAAEQAHLRRSVEASLADAEAAVRQDVQNALLDRSVALKNITTAEKSRAQARENWRITRVQYDQQVATSTDVIDARSYLTSADSNYYQALYAYMDALAVLDYATGKPVVM